MYSLLFPKHTTPSIDNPEEEFLFSFFMREGNQHCPFFDPGFLPIKE